MTPELSLERGPLAVQVGAHTAEIRALQDGQKELGSSMVRIEDKLDGLKMWLLGAVFAGATLAASAVGALVLVLLKAPIRP